MITNFIPSFSLEVVAGQAYETAVEFIGNDTIVVEEACSISVDGSQYFKVEAYSRIGLKASTKYTFNTPMMLWVGNVR